MTDSTNSTGGLGDNIDKLTNNSDLNDLFNSKIIDFSKNFYDGQKNKRKTYNEVCFSGEYSYVDFLNSFKNFLQLSNDRDDKKILQYLDSSNQREYIESKFLYFKELISIKGYKSQRLRNELSDLFFKLYYFSNRNDRSFNVILSELDFLDEKELLQLSSSSDGRYEFLIKIFGKESKLPSLKRDVSIRVSKLLEGTNISSNIRKKILTKINELNKKGEIYRVEEIENILLEIKQSISYLNGLDPNQISILFDFDIFSNEEKKELVSSFLPICSLQDLVDFGIINKELANRIKNEKIKQDLSLIRNSNIDDLDNGFIAIRDATSLDDISVSTGEFNYLGADFGFYTKISDSYNIMIEKVKKDYEKSSILFFSSFLEKIKMDRHLSGIFENSDDFAQSATLIIETKTTGEKKQEKIFWDIGEIGGTGFYFINKNFGTKYKSGKIEGNSDDFVSFQSFIEFLQSGNVSKISVLSPELRKQKIESGELSEFNSTYGEPSNIDFKNYTNNLISESKLLTSKIDLLTSDLVVLSKKLSGKNQEEINLDKDLKNTKNIKLKKEDELSILNKQLDELNLKLYLLKDEQNFDGINSKLDEIDLLYEQRKNFLLRIEREREEIDINSYKKQLENNGIDEFEIDNYVRDYQHNIIDNRNDNLILENDDELLNLIERKNSYEDVKENIIGDLNYTYLKNKLEEIDYEGNKFGLEIGTSFLIEEKLSPDDNLESIRKVFTITKIDKNTRTIGFINPQIGYTEFSFEEFYDLFSGYNAKRISLIKDFKDLVNQAKLDSNVGKLWEGFTLDHGHLIKEGSHSHVEYNYLVSDDGDDLFKIEGFEGNNIKLRVGELKEENYTEIIDDHGHEKKVNKTKDLFGLSDTVITVSYGFLLNYLKNKKLKPRSKDEAKDNEHHTEINQEKRSWSFATWFFSNKSAGDYIKGFKMGIDAIGHYLHEGQEDHAAHFALKAFGILPWDLKSDIVARVEGAEKKHMDEYITKLKGVDSPIATGMIEKWLLKSNCPQYKLEAGMLFMLENYGTLYTKKLYVYKGQYLWYTALGGVVGDHLFHEVEEDCKKQKIQFSEEELVHRLLKAQCNTEAHHPSGIHRRSRVHKEFEGTWKAGMKKDYDKGVEDGAGKRTIQGRVKGAIGELEGGTYPNAMGWFEKIIDKGGPMDEMNKVPFIMLFSGIAYGFGQKMADQFKNSMNHGRNIPACRFISYTSDIDLFNQTVLELGKRFKEIYKGDGFLENMYSDAMKVNSGIGKNNEKTQIKNTVQFYEKYGEILTRTMYMTDHDDVDKHNKTDKMIFLEKDTNPVFKKYYDLFRAYNYQDINYTVKDYMTDAFKLKGTSGMHLYKFSKDVLYQYQGGFRQKEIGPDAWREVERGIYADLVRDVPLNQKKLILKDKFRQLLAGLLESHGSDPRMLAGFNEPTSPFAPLFNKLGITFDDFLKESITGDILLDGTNKKAEDLLDKYVDNSLDGKDHSDEVVGGVNGLITQMKTRTRETTK